MGGFGSYRELDSEGAVRSENISIDHLSPTSPPVSQLILRGIFKVNISLYLCSAVCPSS